MGTLLVRMIPKVSSAAQQLIEATVGFKLAPRQKHYAGSRRMLGIWYQVNVRVGCCRVECTGEG